MIRVRILNRKRLKSFLKIQILSLKWNPSHPISGTRNGKYAREILDWCFFPYFMGIPSTNTHFLHFDDRRSWIQRFLWRKALDTIIESVAYCGLICTLDSCFETCDGCRMGKGWRTVSDPRNYLPLSTNRTNSPRSLHSRSNPYFQNAGCAGRKSTMHPGW